MSMSNIILIRTKVILCFCWIETADMWFVRLRSPLT